MFDRETEIRMIEISRLHGVAPAVLMAVAEVESGGRLFAKVNGNREPLIRFEGHYFDRRLTGAKQAKARELGLASPVAGAVGNPSGQAARWAMLARACAIDAQAAYESTSWGLGQVMGAHWKWLGYSTVEAMAAECRSGAVGQIGLMVRYVEKAGLFTALRRQDWEAFARGYNGPGYAKHAYDRRMADAYARHQKRLDARPPAVLEVPHPSPSKPARQPAAKIVRPSIFAWLRARFAP